RVDVDAHVPVAVWGDPDREGEAVLVDLGRLARRDDRLARVRVALVAQHQASIVDARQRGALLLERVLDLEQICEVRPRLDVNGDSGRLTAAVEDRDGLSN